VWLAELPTGDPGVYLFKDITDPVLRDDQARKQFSKKQENDGKKIESFEGSDNGAHRKNWIKAIQTRKVTHGLIEEGHLSTSMCHLANISYLAGAEKANAQLADAVASDLTTKDAYWRMLDHLKSNEVDLDATKPIVGPLLKVDGKTETLSHGDQVITDAANNCPIRKRTGRKGFEIPQIA
jgi:hypothetical protein